jgi:hypothetical protein
VQVVFWGGFVPGPREVTEVLWNACCEAAVATGLTGAVHRSDRCSTGSKPCKFPLCVFVCFGSEGCVLVPRSSGTPVATWALPTWVVSWRRVLEAVFVLLESPSPSRIIFIGSHSLPPPLWFVVSVLQAKLLPTKLVILKWNAYQGAAKASNRDILLDEGTTLFSPRLSLADSLPCRYLNDNSKNAIS